MKLKQVAMREAKAELSDVVNDSQRNRVVLTKHGHPVAILIGVDGYDMDDLMLGLDEELWTQIAERRADKRPGVSHAEVLRLYGGAPVESAAQESTARRTAR